jgi:hypothetical protein
MKKYIIPAIALTVISLASCRKDTAVTTPTPQPTQGQYTSLSAIFSDATVKSKSVTIDAATGGSFYGKDGTRFVVQPNSLIKPDGTPVTGNVDIEIREYLKRSDMLFSKVLPISNGQPLVSGGEVFFNPKQNGQQLLLKDGMYMQANIPQAKPAPAGMDLFIGEWKEAGADNNNVNWNRGGKGAGGTQQGFGSVVYNGDTLQLFSDSIGYCNADQFMTNPNYQSFTVNISGVTIPANTTVSAYALYDTYNGMWPMSNITGNVIAEGHVPNIPVHFVVMLVVNGHFYGGIAGATPANGGTYTVTVAETDPTTLKNQIDAL